MIKEPTMDDTTMTLAALRACAFASAAHIFLNYYERELPEGSLAESDGEVFTFDPKRSPPSGGSATAAEFTMGNALVAEHWQAIVDIAGSLLATGRVSERAVADAFLRACEAQPRRLSV